MRCDVIAMGILAATKSLPRAIPIVVRLAGTRVNEAKKILDDSGLRIITAEDLDDAAQKAVKITQIMGIAEQGGLKVSFELPI